LGAFHRRMGVGSGSDAVQAVPEISEWRILPPSCFLCRLSRRSNAGRQEASMISRPATVETPWSRHAADCWRGLAGFIFPVDGACDAGYYPYQSYA
jgi:hypothetical protein